MQLARSLLGQSIIQTGGSSLIFTMSTGFGFRSLAAISLSSVKLQSVKQTVEYM